MGDARQGALGGGSGTTVDGLDLFFELSVDLLLIANRDGTFRRLNPAWERVLGYPLADLYRMSWADLVHPDDQPRTLSEFRRANPSAMMSFENRYRHRDGSYRWLEWSATLVSAEGVYYAVARDVTERRAEQERLRTSEAYRAAVQEASTDAIVAIDADGYIVDINAAGQRMYGYRAEQACAKLFCDLVIPPERRAAFQADLVRWRKAEGRIVEFRAEQVGMRADGSRFPLELTVTRLESGPAAFATFARDLTDAKRAEEERRSLEDQVRQAQKMEAVGRLAGAVAHDFNDLLAATTGYVAGAKNPAGHADERLEQMKRATERAVGLVDRLLAFGRRQAPAPKVLDVNVAVGELEHLLRGLLRDDISLQLALAPDVARVKADPAQLQQALVNLVLNAREALRAGGRLRISTSNVGLEAARLPPGLGAQPGAYVRITVEDNGVGMTREVAARAFEPFFTTKESTGASGLGLTTVYGIVAQNGGLVRIESAPGRGTIVQVLLPAAEDAIAQVPSSSPPASTVLLVEDEEAVRQLVRRILEGRGYKVLLARHGGEALELIHQRDLPIHLLLTDAVMPVLSGPELLRRAIALRPAMKVAIMSGYTDRPAVTGVPFIGKPFTPAELERRVREILGGAPAGAARCPEMTDDDLPPRARELITRLGLAPHPERGHYVETYRAQLQLGGLPHGAPRAASTAIYFLVTRAQPTTYLHRLRSDEVFHLYEGGPLEVLLLRDGGPGTVARLGLDVAAGERPQIVIPTGTWFAVELAAAATHCLFGCTVAPGFDFADFELAQGPELAARFPTHAARIARMTRPA